MILSRRAVLTALAALPLAAHPAFAQQQAVASASATPGSEARILRQGEGFLLEVTGLRFNIGMPPTLQMGNFEIQRLAGQPVEVSLGGRSVTLTPGAAGAGRFQTSGSEGGVAYRSSGGGTAAGFLVIVVTAAAVLGDALRGGGRGQIRIGERSTGFLLDVLG